MNILVTGGAGYIGDSVVESLIWPFGEHRVVVMDNLIYGGSYLRDVKFIRADVRDTAVVKHTIETNNIDTVIHLAAIVGDGACSANPEYTIDVNENATRRLVDICKELNVKMVFASTCSVYGANNDVLTEDSPTKPLSLYAGTKLNSEKYIEDNLDNYVIFRLGTLFGLSSHYARLRCDLVANILTYKAVLGETLHVFGGEQWRPMLHVRDAAFAFATAAIKDGVFPIGKYILSKENVTIGNLADRIIESVGAGEVIKTDAKFEDLRNYKVDNSKSKFEPTLSIEAGIKEMARVVREGRISNVWDSKYHNAKYIKEILNV